MDMDASTRMYEAKKFLTEYPQESATTVCRMFHLPSSTLQTSLLRESKTITPKTRQSNGGHNKVLQEHQTAAVHKFIRSLLSYSMPPTKPLVFNAIRSLKLKENSLFQGPTKRWFQKWWKENKLHTIKTKPLATIRYTAADAKEVENWFQGYKAVLRKLNIRKKRNITNFDEQGVRVGCMKKQDIIVPEDILEFYSLSPENRQSLTIFESINATGEYPIPPMLIMQGQELMESWFSEGLSEGTKILTSKNGFTSDEIAMFYLQHFIDHSDAGPDADWKLLLMDNHGSHITPEFTLLANENHIRPYRFIPHLTHCMQPLDVGVFQQFKAWHDVDIQDAMAEFNLEYSMVRFCRDLIKIRDNTFKKSTIQSAFEKCGMWPINSSKCIDMLRKFVPGHGQMKSRKDGLSLSSAAAPLSEPTLPRIRPETLNDVELGLMAWKEKIDAANMQWSDPLREEELNQYVNSAKEVIAESHFKDYELSLHQKRRADELTQRATSRKRLKPTVGVLGITKEDALTAIADKRRKEDELVKKREHNQYMKFWRMERDNILAKGIITRKEEKARLRKIKEYTKQGVFVPVEDATPIVDPEVEWKATNFTWLAEEARKLKTKEKNRSRAHNPENDEEEDDLGIIIDTVGDRSLLLRDALLENDDFVGFEETDSDDDVQLHLGPDRLMISTD